MKVPLSARGASTAIAFFFAAKIASGLLLLKLSAAALPVDGFGFFSQFLLFGALITSVAVAGVQAGVVREVAAGDAEALRRVVAGAGVLWGAAAAVIGPISLLFARPISEALCGSPEFAWAVPPLAFAALLSGPTQIACAVLTGLGRVRASLTAQAAGLAVGSAAAAVLLLQGAAVPAALAFYAGSLAAVPVAVLPLRSIGTLGRLRAREAIAEARLLLRYSGSFVLVTSMTTLTLFALRYSYLSAFDTHALGYWMVAQRISDTSTQLLGLFMVQYVVPAYAAAAPESRVAILRRSWLIGTGTMLALLLIFAAAPSLWIGLLLSRDYLPATWMILGYMAADVLRGTTSLAAHAALARSRLMLYAAVDISAVGLMAVITLTLIAQRDAAAPVIGYFAAYATLAVLIAVLARGWRMGHRGAEAAGTS